MARERADDGAEHLRRLERVEARVAPEGPVGPEEERVAPRLERADVGRGVVHNPARILHAHFKPCDALPNRLCPSPKTEATAREREDATKALKNACVAVNAADAKDKRPKAPCSCKGKHFTDVLMPKV